MWIRLGILTLVWGAFSAFATPAIAGCEGQTAASDDPRAEYEQAQFVGIGRMRTDADGSRIVDFDQVIKGDASAEMNIGPKPTACGPDAVSTTSGIFLVRDGQQWFVASAPSDAALAAADPLPHNGSGTAVLLEQTASSRDPLVTLDEEGRALTSSAPDRAYDSISVCPGRQTAIAWRHDGTSDRLGLPGLESLGPGPSVASPRPFDTLAARCNTSDGSVALAVYEGRHVDAAALLTLHGSRTLLRNAGFRPQIADARHILTQRGNQLELVDTVTGKVRWRLHRPLLLADQASRVAPDGKHAVVTIGTAERYNPVIVDLQGVRPDVRHFPNKYYGDPQWVGSTRIVMGRNSGNAVTTSPIVDLRGRLVGSYRGGANPAPVVAGSWMYNVNLFASLERASRTGGTATTRPLPLWAADLQPLTG